MIEAVTAKNNSIVIGVVAGEFTIKKLKIMEKNIYLMPENKNFSPVKVEEDFYIWGVGRNIAIKLKSLGIVNAE